MLPEWESYSHDHMNKPRSNPPPIANACIFPIQPIKFAVTSYYICQMTVKFSLLLFLCTKMGILSAWKYFYIYPAYVPVAYGLADVDWKE